MDWSVLVAVLMLVGGVVAGAGWQRGWFSFEPTVTLGPLQIGVKGENIFKRGPSYVDDHVKKVVAKHVRRHFRRCREYLLVRYGSSTRTTSPRDLDYLAILLDYVPSGQHEMHERVLLDEEMRPCGQLTFEAFSTFVFNLTAGMPYEHGVIRGYTCVSGSPSYLKMLRSLSDNLHLQRDFIVKKLKQLGRQCREELSQHLDEEESEAASRKREYGIAYDMASCALQIKYLRERCPAWLRAPHVDAIAHPPQMLAFAQEAGGEEGKLYMQLRPLRTGERNASDEEMTELRKRIDVLSEGLFV